jgi:hypothetical protein
MLFSPTIGAAISARYWCLWVLCPACRTTTAIDLHTLDQHHDAAVNSLIPTLPPCRPNAPFAELVRLSWTSIADARKVGDLCRVVMRRPTIDVPRSVRRLPAPAAPCVIKRPSLTPPLEERSMG